jgi:hypothetical protein
MLHIHNGDSTADTARQSSLAGEHFAFRESLITGPTPSDLSGNEWRKVRAGHLYESYGGNAGECEESLLRQEEKLASFSEHDEVVLWFEHDLFCQLHLLYLLDWFSQRDLGKTKLSLICIGEFPGKENFRGLGELSAEQLASLFPARQQVTGQQMNLAISAWQAYRSPKPTDIEKVLLGESSTLPFLRAALQAHLERFPSTKNGLGRIENRALEFIAGGLHNFVDLFSRFVDAEPVYGLGDAQFWLALHRMKAARKSFVQITGRENGGNGNHGQDSKQFQELSPEVVHMARLEMTALGESALKGEADFINVNGIDLWLGGVHLTQKDTLWRWDEESGKVVSSSA